MDQYIQQLLEDLYAAHKPETESSSPEAGEGEGMEGHFTETERI